MNREGGGWKQTDVSRETGRVERFVDECRDCCYALRCCRICCYRINDVYPRNDSRRRSCANWPKCMRVLDATVIWRAQAASILMLNDRIGIGVLVSIILEYSEPQTLCTLCQTPEPARRDRQTSCLDRENEIPNPTCCEWHTLEFCERQCPDNCIALYSNRVCHLPCLFSPCCWIPWLFCFCCSL